MKNTPYTYLLGWSTHNMWYYGVRYSKNCHPRELWIDYKTSSKHVHAFAEIYGDPDIIQIRKTFCCGFAARNWEERVLKRLKVVKKSYFLNLCDSISIDPSAALKGACKPKPLGFAKGQKNSMYGKKRPDVVVYNKTRVNPWKGKKRTQHSSMMSGSNNPMAEKGKGLFFWNNGYEIVRSKDSPGPEWVRGRKL